MTVRGLLLSCALVAVPALARMVPPDIPLFVRGADVSGLTQMERQKGAFFMTELGVRTECLQLMHGYGLRAVRLQVCVDPTDGWCDADDTLAKAVRAKRAGLDVMLVFRYSNVRSGAAAREMPEAWKGYDETRLLAAVSNHTSQVLQRLKDHEIAPRWVQLGGSLTDGFLYPFGHIDANPDGFARCFAAGAKAVKALFPRAAVVIHFDSVSDPDRMGRTLEILRSNSIWWDVVSCALFPSPEDDAAALDARVESLLKDLRRIAYEWSCDTLVGEIGFPCRPEEYERGRRRLAYLLDSAVKIRRCRGVFYYEPQARPRDSRMPLGAFDNFGHPTPIMEGFR